MSSALKALATFVAAFVVAFVHGWKLSLVMYTSSPLLSISPLYAPPFLLLTQQRFACIPVLAGIGIVVMGSIKKQQTLSQDVYAHAGAVAEQAFSGIRTVYVFFLFCFFFLFFFFLFCFVYFLPFPSFILFEHN
jgi:ABC-type multidrug transport system fused ATPase/permease subunit